MLIRKKSSTKSETQMNNKLMPLETSTITTTKLQNPQTTNNTPQPQTSTTKPK